MGTWCRINLASLPFFYILIGIPLSLAILCTEILTMKRFNCRVYADNDDDDAECEVINMTQAPIDLSSDDEEDISISDDEDSESDRSICFGNLDPTPNSRHPPQQGDDIFFPFVSDIIPEARTAAQSKAIKFCDETLEYQSLTSWTLLSLFKEYRMKANVALDYFMMTPKWMQERLEDLQIMFVYYWTVANILTYQLDANDSNQWKNLQDGYPSIAVRKLDEIED